VIRILVIDPHKHIGDGVTGALEADKMAVSVVYNREEALLQLEREPPDAVVLALGPSWNWGEDLCRDVCERTLAPVRAVGKIEHYLAVERALAAGADAHALQPCSTRILVAQLWALLRRVGLSRPANPG
jgi:DNA-binding response OmpR family regulator